MNARQKAKRLKKELERIKGQTVRPILVESTHKIDNFGVTRTFPLHDIELVKDDVFLIKVIGDEILRNKDFWNHMLIETYFDYHTARIVVSAKLGVVDYSRGVVNNGSRFN